MTFAEFNQLFQDHFEHMSENVDRLYEVDVDKDYLWNLYLDSFPAEKNKVFRKRREFDCFRCRHFIRSFGNVVAIKDGVVRSVWDFDTNDDTYAPVVAALSTYIHSRPISGVYFTRERQIGVEHNQEYFNGEIIGWDHLNIKLPNRFVQSNLRTSAGEFKGRKADVKNVFKRSLDEISIDAVDTVLELIESKSLYRGSEWEYALKAFRQYKDVYSKISSEYNKDLYAWECSEFAGEHVGKIRNHSIGTLLVDISEGMSLDRAVGRYEAIVAPANYKRLKAIYTQKMLDDARNKIVELGYMDSLPRRHATLNDISVNNILFCNRDAANHIRGGDVFSDMASSVSRKPMNFDNVYEIGIDEFIRDVVPTAKELEVYLENRHTNNMVSLIAPRNADAPSMFKWNNNFGWAYAGNVTDSLKENVKAAGGKVDGELRFSIQWNDGDDFNGNDFDAHCLMKPLNHEIYYANKYDPTTRGELDVDIRWPKRGQPAVENITWPNRYHMQTGDYLFYVHNYAHNGGRSGFKAEIEFDGQIHHFEYNKELKPGEWVEVATVNLKGGMFSIKPKLPDATSSKTYWNVATEQFVPVSVMMYSPNYWDGQNGIGHQHCFFMLKDCKNPEEPNGFYNEFLKNELMEHKRVFEALGGRMKVTYDDNQLSGIGFSMTKRSDLYVRVSGDTNNTLYKKVMKVIF